MKQTPQDLPAGSIPVRCEFTELVPPDELKPHPRNPNTHPPAQLQLLGEIITHQGWRAPIVVSARSGFIVTGHARHIVAKQLGCFHVPVDFQDFDSEEDELAHLLADNKIPELAEINKDALAQVVESLRAKGVDLRLAAIIDDLAPGKDATQAEYPIVPKLLENYDYVLIFTTSETDFLFLKNLLNLETVRSYKKTGVGVGRVVPFPKFLQSIHENIHTLHGAGGNHDHAQASARSDSVRA